MPHPENAARAKSGFDPNAFACSRRKSRTVTRSGLHARRSGAASMCQMSSAIVTSCAEPSNSGAWQSMAANGTSRYFYGPAQPTLTSLTAYSPSGFGRNHGLAPGIFLVAWSYRKPANFRDHAPAGTTAMTNAESEKGRRPAAFFLCAEHDRQLGGGSPWGTRCLCQAASDL